MAIFKHGFWQLIFFHSFTLSRNANHTAKDYLFKLNNRGIKKSEICSKLTKDQKHHWHCSGNISVTFVNVLHLFLLFLLPSLSMCLLSGWVYVLDHSCVINIIDINTYQENQILTYMKKTEQSHVSNPSKI